jgi:penicillin-binding protein 1C
MVVDRDGRLLRPYTTPEGRWRLPATRADIDPRLFDILFAYEDKRYAQHHGVDLLALGRALSQLLLNGRIVSGASTISMQVARLLEPRSERSFAAKLRQIVRAIELERALGKDEILSLYLSLAPYGGNLEGIRAASLSYFGKEPRRLSLAGSALLVALPQAPSCAVLTARSSRAMPATACSIASRPRASCRSTRSSARVGPVHRAQDRVIHAFDPDTHSADAVIAAAPERSIHRLTLDATLQKSLEDLARDRARALGPMISIAIVAVDHATGEILARVASADYFDVTRAGQVDMTTALRSPDSTLKPFIYGLGIEDGLVHPETLIEDRPVRYGSYAPENFDLSFQGTVTVRKALQLSLNVPAVAVLDKIGASRFTARLEQAGGALVLPKGEVPGLAMGLGGVGVRLVDLVAPTAALRGSAPPSRLSERLASEMPVEPPRRLLDPVAAWRSPMCSSARRRPRTPPARIASGQAPYGYRDAWSVGFDGKRTIGVWVGRPDGAPVPGLNGRVAAAPILFDAFARTGKLPQTLPPAPKGTLIASNAKLPPPLQRFRGSGEGSEALRIMFPPNGARLELASGEDGKPEPIALKVAGGTGAMTVLVNGMPLPEQQAGRRRTLLFAPEGPGFVRLTVIDGAGATDSVMVRLQ